MQICKRILPVKEIHTVRFAADSKSEKNFLEDLLTLKKFLEFYFSSLKLKKFAKG